MSKHTKGPYVIEHVRPWPNCPGVHDFVIKSAHGIPVAWITSRLDWEEMQANAQLIAAAPELLAACKLAETVMNEIYERENKTSAHGQRVRSDISENIGFIRAAIAKAEGQ